MPGATGLFASTRRPRSERALDEAPAGSSGTLPRRIAALGLLTALAIGAQTVFSYGMATVAPFGAAEPREATAFAALARSLQFFGDGVQAYVSGRSALAREEIFVLAYSVPFLVSSAAFIALMIVLSRHRRELDAAAPAHLFRWSILFAALAWPAAPAMVQDFWLSPAWGRMLAAGANAYHADLTPEIARGLPLDMFDHRMTYAPLWAVVSAAVMAVAGANVLLAGALFKSLLMAGWIAVLRLVRTLLRERSAWEQCVGLAIWGWLPLGVSQSVAEGHNDVIMVLLLLLWLLGLERRQAIAGRVALAGSMLVKYVTAPAFLLDALHAFRSRRLTLPEYARQLAPAAAVVLAGLALFYRSPDFFGETAGMAKWHFYTTADAVAGLAHLLGVEPEPGSLAGGLFLGLAAAARAVFVIAAVTLSVSYARRPGRRAFRRAVLACMAGVLFGIMSHIWPWFLLWVLGPASLVPGSALGRWSIGVALAAPFPILSWVVFPHGDPFLLPALALYGFALLWFAAVPRRWFPASTGEPS
jgi:alpha-1,6-mannosyltransferase